MEQRELARGFLKELDGATTGEELADRLSVGLQPFVQFKESVTINGKPIASLRDYLALVLETTKLFNVLELIFAIVHANSVAGSQELFFARPFGGFSTTRPQTA
jgi:hypothetical protein